MIVFWVAAALLSVAAAVLIVLRAARAAEHRQAEDPSLVVYRRQLGEIDDLADRGLLPEAERRSARTEAARRLLAAADAQDHAQAAPDARAALDARAATDARAAPGEGGRARGLVIALAAAAPLVALGIYLFVGSPQTPDQPFARRLKAWSADPSSLGPEQMAAVLTEIAAKHPDDAVPLVYLSHADVAAGDLTGAEQAIRKALSIDPKRGELWGLLGEILTDKAGQDGTPEAMDAFHRAIALDPSLAGPRYYLARAQIAGGDVKDGLAAWRALGASLPAADPRRPGLLAEIAAVEKTGALATAQAGQPAVDPRAMIRAMVARQAAQLEAQPDDPQGWGRLIRSYGVLGDEPRRQAALARAQALFKNRPDAWKAVENAEANAQ
ncbi:MAG TPA: c-type cytochrome biogenesis protein CcmI [Caulobacteraceae bacterium]|jgi:cytochrome c-type biogenesis protein CcmH|nr:c-type cytochrome biogenesis protein CcmI [Caulobacteraceae bacterium]